MNTCESSTHHVKQHVERVGPPFSDRSERATQHEGQRHKSPKAREEVDKEGTEDLNEEEHDDEESDETPSLPGQGLSRFINKTLPQIPNTDFSDLMDDSKFSTFITPSSSVVEEKVNKRASNVMKLAQENEKLQVELKAMAERLDAMERRRAQLAAKEQKILEEPPS